MAHCLRTIKCLLWLTSLAAVLLLSACAADAPPPSAAVVQVNPLAEAVSNDEIVARLYYGFTDRLLLAGETRRIKVPVNESIETSVLNELIREGPSQMNAGLTQVINPETQVVAAAAEGQYLAVTLSREFLTQPGVQSGGAMLTGQAERTRRSLAVYSVVNTLIEQGNYARVRLLIDEDGSGSGRPITREEAGLSGSGECEPLARNGEIELTALNTMRELLQAVEQRDWPLVYDFIAYKNQYGQDKPSLEEFRNEVERARFTLSSPQVLDDVLAADGNSEIVMISYDLRPQDGETQSFSNVPRRLVLENDVWKMTYNAFDSMFLS